MDAQETIASAADADTVLSIQIVTDRTTGYAAVQNNIPVVRNIVLENRSDTRFRDLELIVTCSPAFAKGVRLRFDELAPGESRSLAPIDMQPEHAYLVSLDEAEMASLMGKASCSGELLAEAQQSIEVLAYDQWAGTRSLPELLAAFSMPNTPAVDRILGKASELLRHSDKKVSLDGYQSKNRENVWKQISAIYSVLLSESLQYANPPASFENDGQKIRTPERIFDGRVGTCLDLAMLFASCFEQAGLHPVVLFKEGHAWVGSWLIEASFPTPIVDDVQSIRKRVQSGEFLTFEATAIATAAFPSLRWARAKADEYLREEGSFQYAVDVQQARALHIRALPSRAVMEVRASDSVHEINPCIEDMPDLPPLDPALLPAVEVGSGSPEARLIRWKGKLLDLTLRNRLLNFKATNSNVKLVCPDFAVLEERLTGGTEFTLKVAPDLMGGQDGREAAVFRDRTGERPLDVFAREALARNELTVESSDGKWEERLLDIFRAAETGKEEGGANTLYLAFGLLQWREEQSAESTHLAPILLIPVTLTRRSVRSGFRLTRHDDDALVNPTLVERLRNDFAFKFPAFEALCGDGKGLDAARIFQIFRLEIADLAGWEVKDEVYLGIFSFTKYLMWKDLQDRQAQLQDNRIVERLIKNLGGLSADRGLGFEPTTLDETFKPQDLFVPLEADSSQLRAICVASHGTDLVLEGPPGTGKSQTITNLIAHLLATGRTVLFVSEKVAALEVVSRRLNSIGLGPFCLELHSAKAKKAGVLEQFDHALAASEVAPGQDWEREAERVAALRQELNALVSTLHRRASNGLTVYEAIGACIKWSHWKAARFDWASSNQHGRKALDALRDLSQEIGARASQLSRLSRHPLVAIRRTAWSPSWERDVFAGAERLTTAALLVRDRVAAVFSVLGLDEQSASWVALEALDHLADALLRAATVPVGIARSATDAAAMGRLKTACRYGRRREGAWAAFGGAFRETIAALDAAEVDSQWRRATNAWWPKSWIGRRSLIKRLSAFRTDGGVLRQAEAPGLLKKLAQLNEADRALATFQAGIIALLPEEHDAHKMDWAAVEGHEQWAQDYTEALRRLAAGDAAVFTSLSMKLTPIIADDRAALQGDGEVGELLVPYRDAYRALATETRAMEDLCGVSGSFIAEPQAPGALSRLLAHIEGWEGARREIQPWCLWQNSREKARLAGLQGIVQAVEAGDVPLTDIADFFEYSYQSWWLNKTLDEEPVLCAFSAADHERKIADFKAADTRFQELTKKYIVAKLSGQVPHATAVAPGVDSEMGYLRREIQKQRKHAPIRQLVRSLPTLLPRLKPCLLMSPLSVAQYLPVDHAPFDVVIFDEASQIPVWDAVGAIARGRQFVCVGDPKQLPPTNFFQRVDGGDDDGVEEGIEDLESILDECLGIGLPSLGLNWHYRSRHESLITFSNVTYYENRLISFPSPTTEDRAVRLEQVNGIYDRGKSRTNPIEAEAVVAAIERHYLGPESQKYSLGVITFNRDQQKRIENLLDARRRASRPLDEVLAASRQEPLFIKNLENVQGDERDIIYFSITYGADQAGKVALNFGPINKQGGHRRLNVAVSRARQRVVVFSSLQPDKIDLARVQAPGPRDLRNYLQFAIQGPRALITQSFPTGREPDSPFEQQVIARLREKGWDVHPQVGAAGYRIDIGVVDPRAPGRYVLGIECDGRSYHSGATARDRDRLRQILLEDLGWTLHRVWSTDWWRNPERCLKVILDRLEALVVADTKPDDVAEKDRAVCEDEAASLTEVREALARPAAYASHAATYPDTAFASVAPAASPTPPVYCVAQITGGEPRMFYEESSRHVLRDQILTVVNREGPVADFVVFRRVARAWGLSRTGNRIEDRLRSLVPSIIRKTREGEDAFYWPQDTVPEEWAGYRVVDDTEESRRPLSEIALEEIGNLAIFLLSQHGSTSVSELARSVCRLWYIARTTTEAEARVAKALTWGRAQALIVIDKGRVRLL